MWLVLAEVGFSKTLKIQEKKYLINTDNKLYTLSFEGTKYYMYFVIAKYFFKNTFSSL